MAQENPGISSPKATGGAGTIFEQHTDAAFLGWLLVGAAPPVLTDCIVTEVHVQTGHLGWHTDDILVIGTNRNGKRKLAGQVKIAFAISSSDAECKKTFEGFWKDIQATDRFNPASDALALIVQRGTNALLNSLINLLDQARTARDASEFTHRLSTKGVLSAKSREQCQEIRTILDGVAGRPVSDEELWRLLTVVHVISFDLNSSTAQTEASVKTLLAHTATDSDKLGSARATWAQLLELAGKAMPNASSYTRDHLPPDITKRHAAIGAPEHTALQALRDHTKTVLDGISTKIGNKVSLHREALVSSCLRLLEDHRVLVITGPSGSGKSGIGKVVVESLQPHTFVFAFRAEEFATAHLDSTLKSITEMSAERVFSLLGAQGRKVLLIESVERLLEASVRDGFSDLLRLILKDESWRVVLTCRDYSVEVVRSSLLEHVHLDHRVVSIPQLTDDELAEVVKAIRALEGPAKNASLKALFRNPYILDMAAGMQWADEGSYPVDERTFRQKVWREVVRDDSHAIAGLPARREKAFIEVALRRARTLTSYVSCDNLDAEALQALRNRSLISYSPHSLQSAAPAHDVLEDWALLAWLESTVESVQRDPALLAAQIEGYPALRRGYRKWLGEILECNPPVGDSFVLAVCEKKELPGQFRDDTLVSALLSGSAKTFLERHRAKLLQDNAALLKRVIHLLRIAAVTKPYWLPTAVASSAVMVPAGTAWEAVLAVVSDSLPQLLPENAPLIVGLISDWARGVSVWNAYPAGASHAARIAFSLLLHLDEHRSEELRKSVYSVILRIPKADADQFLKLVEQAASFKPHPADHRDIRALLLDGIECGFACRDFPDAVIAFAQKVICLSKEESDDIDWSNGIDLEVNFGIRPGHTSDFFPASAWRGPFRALLKWHPQKGVDFILRFVNHAVQWQAEGTYPNEHLDTPEQVKLEIPGHETVTQWCNDRLWCLYRGTTVAPPLLQSALMALEDWLLEQCANPKFDLEGWLLRLLTQANNVAITAIVASLSNAYPSRAGRAAVALLTSPAFIRLDRMRMAREHQAPSTISSVMPSIRAGDEFHEGDRRKADALGHRRGDLEHLARNLQLTKYQEDVWRIIDGYRAQLPDPKEQTEEDKLWRLALHRMDIRHFRVASDDEATAILASVPKKTPETPADNKDVTPTDQVVLRGGPLDADIQAFVNEGAPERALIDAHLTLVNWGAAQWARRSADQAADWRAKLMDARKRAAEEEQLEVFAQGGPGLVAAVCARDHWGEMSPDDQEWCVNILISAIERDCDSTDHFVHVTRMSILPSRPAAYVLPYVYTVTSSQALQGRVLEALAKALTHASTEVVEHAAAGIGHYFAKAHADIIRRYVTVVLSAASTANKLVRQEERKPYDQRRRGMDIVQESTKGIRPLITPAGAPPGGEMTALDLDQWPTREIAKPVLQLLSRCPNIQEAEAVFVQVAKQLGTWWDRERRSRDEAQRDYHFEHACIRWICRFILALPPEKALQVCQPLLAAVEHHPREVANFIWDAVLVEDQSDNKTSFWDVWKAFAERITKVRWANKLDTDHATGTDLLYRMFLGVGWEKGVQHWRRLDECPSCVDNWFEQLPPSPGVWQCYCTFLYQIGSKSLPHAFIRLADRLDPDGRMLTAKNTVFLLESILRRSVYSTPQALKEDPRLKTATLKLLDALVEAGSSSAYRMRDDFVTPMTRR